MRSGGPGALRDVASMQLGPVRAQFIYYVERMQDTLAACAWWGDVAIRARLLRPHLRRAAGPPHLALLAWYFPPSVTGGTYRPTSLSRRCADFGWRVSVIAGPVTGAPSAAGTYLLQTLPEDVRIHRVSPPAIDPSPRCVPYIDGGFVNMLATVSLARRVFHDDPPTVILATGPPFHNFVAAYYIARMFGAKWVLEYRDEWSECPFDFVWAGAADRRWEAYLLRRADAVIFTTRSQLAHHLAVFPGLEASKGLVIPNGWELDDFSSTDAGPEPAGLEPRRLVIAHVGSQFPHALPGPFLSTLEQVLARSERLRRELRLRFVGQKSREVIEQLSQFAHPEILESIDHVPKPEAIRLMKESAALLLFNGPKFERYLPGKIYDYLAAGPPLLVFGEGGEIDALVKRLGAGLVVPWSDPEALGRALTLLAEGAVPANGRPDTRAWLQEHRRDVLAGQTFRVLNGLASRDGT